MRKFFTLDQNVVRECSEAMRANRQHCVFLATDGSNDRVSGFIQKIERVSPEGFEISIGD